MALPELLRIASAGWPSASSARTTLSRRLLLLAELADEAADRIYRSIVGVDGDAGAAASRSCGRTTRRLDPLRGLRHDEARVHHRADKCHVSHVVGRHRSGSRSMRRGSETCRRSSPTSRTRISTSPSPTPRTARSRTTSPTSSCCIDDGHGRDDPLNLIVEVTGERKKDKPRRWRPRDGLWVPAVNNHGGFGRWAFLEVLDPWNIETQLRTACRSFLGPLRGKSAMAYIHDTEHEAHTQ